MRFFNRLTKYLNVTNTFSNDRHSDQLNIIAMNRKNVFRFFSVYMYIIFFHASIKEIAYIDRRTSVLVVKTMLVLFDWLLVCKIQSAIEIHCFHWSRN